MDEKPNRRRLRFGLRTLFEIIAVVAFILALLAYRQPQTVPIGGRYQSHHIGGGWIHVLDTETGELWTVGSGGQWHPLGRAPNAVEQGP